MVSTVVPYASRHGLQLEMMPFLQEAMAGGLQLALQLPSALAWEAERRHVLLHWQDLFHLIPTTAATPPVYHAHHQARERGTQSSPASPSFLSGSKPDFGGDPDLQGRARIWKPTGEPGQQRRRNERDASLGSVSCWSQQGGTGARRAHNRKQHEQRAAW